MGLTLLTGYSQVVHQVTAKHLLIVPSFSPESPHLFFSPASTSHTSSHVVNSLCVSVIFSFCLNWSMVTWPWGFHKHLQSAVNILHCVVFFIAFCALLFRSVICISLLCYTKLCCNPFCCVMFVALWKVKSSEYGYTNKTLNVFP